MLNPFFQQGSKSEQGLIQDLINEQLRMYGIDVHYIPRSFITEKTVIREVIESEFNNAYPIEAYIDNYEGYGDNTTILSKFGIQALNEVNLIISRERFKNYISPLIQNQTNIKLSSRPKEGDLIYFPLGNRLFEIKFVEHEKPFYQLQGLYTYQLKCELFRYEDELVTNRGGGYTITPTVGISSSPPGGKTAVAVALMIDDIVVCNQNVSPNASSVQSVEITNPGFGYTVAPGVRFIGGGGKGATGIASIGSGVVGIITVTNGGSGYITPPTITFTGVSTVSAAATAVVSTGGSITSIRITNAGAGYTIAPTITIGNPILTSTGNFVLNEVVVGSSSSTTARVKSWNSTTRVLQVSQITGKFTVGENIVGSASSASYYLKTVDDYVRIADDGYAANNEIEDEADQIIDFSEVNPFGMP